MSDDFDEALKALARLEGKTVDELKAEMLRAKLTGGRDQAAPLARTATGDASGGHLARREAIAQHHGQEFPGTPVVRYRGDDYDETPAQARERWLEEEAMLPDGVHGLGGMSAGGIFGSGPIATDIYDPEAMTRAESRAGQTVNLRMLSVIERLEARLLGSAEPPALPGRSPRRLPPRGGR